VEEGGSIKTILNFAWDCWGKGRTRQ